jgi:8-oxo-dGTP pyrophosphatase MutT (NUDIX family)
MTEHKSIHIAAALITNSDGLCLLVRKKGSSFFMQPGGKPEAGEQTEDALVRELQEELNVCVDKSSLVSMGRFVDTAINEPGHSLHADIFRITDFCGDISPAAEIEQILWLDPNQPATVAIAPLTKDQLLPLLNE